MCLQKTLPHHLPPISLISPTCFHSYASALPEAYPVCLQHIVANARGPLVMQKKFKERKVQDDLPSFSSNWQNQRLKFSSLCSFQ